MSDFLSEMSTAGPALPIDMQWDATKLNGLMDWLRPPDAW